MHKKIIKKFTDHPKSMGENYWNHFSFALWISMECSKISVIALTHAIFPFLFLTDASYRLEKLSQAIQNRRGHEKGLNGDCG
jgi:hypothetical protein